MPFDIRNAELSDIPMIVTLVRNSYRGESSQRGWTTGSRWIEGLRTDEPQIKELLEKPKSILFVGEEDATMRGCCHVEQRGEVGCFDMLAVDPEHQGGGFGRQLVSSAEAMARQWGLKGMQIKVLDRQPELMLWYGRQGYAKTGERMSYPADERFGRPSAQGLYLETLLKTF